MKQMYVKFICLFLALTMLGGAMVACGGDGNVAETAGATQGENVTVGDTEASTQASADAETDAETDVETQEESPAQTEGLTEEQTQATTEDNHEVDPPETADVDVSETDAPETEAQTEAQTEDPSQRINKPTEANHITFYEPNRPKLSQIFSNANQCKASVVMDETYGSVIKLTTNANASDPNIIFNYKTYISANKLDVLSADEYKYIVMTIRVDQCTSETFELFYAAGKVTGVTPGLQTSASFSGSETGWQKIIFDLSNADFSGDINLFRFDFFTAGSAAGGDTMYIYAMDFYKTRGEAYAGLDIDMTRPGEGSDLTETPVAGVNYDKQNAPQEDRTVNMWFDHITEKVYQNVTTPSDMNTYVISMAGNSIENCQFFLAPKANRTFRIEMSEFRNSQGNTLKSQILKEHYVNINGQMVPDALPPLNGNVTVSGGKSQGFVIKVWADTNEQAGLYTATLNVYDANTGNHIKMANVYVNVWDFSLSDETALKTAININAWPIAVSYQNAGMTAKSQEELYKIYYDFMLENRMSAYKLPYAIGDSRCEAYLNNPRVTAFAINKSNNDEAGVYQILKNNPNWLKKGYFYYVDEPTNMELLNNLANAGNRLSGTFPGYRQVSPFFTNLQVDENTDQIEFMKRYVNIWCTKVFAFTPRDKAVIPGAQFMTTSAQDAKFGTFEERLNELRKRGDELWLYFCWEPGQPYANWLALGDGTEPIVSIWQCAMTDATGVLYWDATYWTSDPMNDLTPLIGATSHGDGVLLYSGAAVGSYEPISSFRFENIRLGIQDYQLLSMLEAKKGEEAADDMIAMVTTDVVTYTNDDDYLHAVRVLLGEMVSDMMK